MDRFENPEHSAKPIVWSAKLVDWFFRNTQVVLLLFLAVLIGGSASLASLRSEGFPAPALNIAVITDLYRGASSAEVENQIVKPLEAAVTGIAGISEVRSTANDNFGTLQISFDSKEDFDAGLSEIRNKIQSVDLPADADKPELIIPSFGGSISYYALTGAQGVEPASLRTQGDYAKRLLEQVDGVKEFKLMQPVTDRVDIAFRAADLGRYGLTPTALQQALQANNITIPAGSIDEGDRVASVVTAAPLTSLDSIKNLVVGATAAGQPVTVSMVADVSLRAENEAALNSYTERAHKGEPATTTPSLFYQLTFAEDADVTSANVAVEEEVEKIAVAEEMDGTELRTIYSVADEIAEQIEEIEKGAIGGPIGDKPIGKLGWALGAIWLITLSMLLFVSWRAAVISTLAIPLSLLITFMALQFQGVSLNTLTLFSMVLVLALIVDPAIVLLEAIQRELDMGKRGNKAVIAAMNTVGIGAFIAVICNTLVFVPFGIVGGVFGEIIKYIPITVIPALIASYFVPVIFLTYLARTFLKPARNHVDDEEIANLWKVSRWFVRTNEKILQRTWAQILIMVLAIFVPLAVAGSMFATGKVVPVQFSSTSDAVAYLVNVEYPSNLSEARKQEVIEKMEAAVAAHPATKGLFATMQSESMVNFTVLLLERSERDKDSSEIAKEMNEGSLGSLSKPEERIFVTAANQEIGGPTVDPIAVNIFGDDLEALKKAAIATGDILRDKDRFPNVVRVNDGFSGENNPQISVAIDRAKLAQTGLPAILVAQALGGVLGENSVSKFEQEIAGASRPVDIYLVNADKPNTLEEVRNTVIGARPTGQPLRVSDVATVTETQGFKGINRLDGQRYVTVSASVKDALMDAAAPQKAVVDFWSADKLNEYGLADDALSDRGAGDQFARSFQKLFLALGVACIILYVVLALFFRSFAYPIIILFAIPLSFVGVFPALSLVGGQFGFLEILGIITLTGIAVNVGIFLIDLANQKRAQGMDYKRAIAEASGIRFRPIFLTKVTALGGLAPLIILSPFWRSLATVVLAGVLVSGVLSLFTTPILYSWFTGASERIQRGWERRVAKK